MEAQRNGNCYVSEIAGRKREGGFLARSGEVVGRGHPCLCKLSVRAGKRGLFFFLGPQYNHGGITPLDRFQWSGPQSPFMAEFSYGPQV